MVAELYETPLTSSSPSQLRTSSFTLRAFHSRLSFLSPRSRIEFGNTNQFYFRVAGFGKLNFTNLKMKGMTGFRSYGLDE